jgi:Flp pilus assembly CpaE family ATPase
MKRIISPLDGFYLAPSKLLEPGDFLIFEMGENLREHMHILHTINSWGRAEEIWVIPNNDSAVTEAAKQGKTPIDFGEGEEICKSFLHLASFILSKDHPGGEERTITFGAD